MKTHSWTVADDRRLRQMRAENVSLAQIAQALGCDVAHVRQRAADLALLGRAGRAGVDVGRVPRPAAVCQPGLIDLSRAPSAMESRYSRGGK